ncbi:MAG: peptide chain release factor N(5)-glutamine methyltransferase [Clostridia bacterium]|nr:peptide chain release factor N(5)-glutamine methyltransferase [Clostridia bacterium]
MTIKEALAKGTVMLKGENLDSPKMKARLLLQDILNKPRQYLLVHDTEQINDELLKKYFYNVEKVKKGTPIEHITHLKEFMKMNFYVNENVLIPRQDTEILVEEAIKIAQKTNAKKILDLCTGSGAIAISIAKYVENSEVTAIDISKEALRVAKKNATNNEVQNQITFIESDLFSKIRNTKFDMIISNPPYIKKEVIKKLSKEVQKEPLIALDGGYDGLDFYKKIVRNAYEYLKLGGYLCLEIGYDQKKSVTQIIEQEGKYINIYSKKDLYDNDRIIVAKLGFSSKR